MVAYVRKCCKSPQLFFQCTAMTFLKLMSAIKVTTGQVCYHNFMNTTVNSANRHHMQWSHRHSFIFFPPPLLFSDAWPPKGHRKTKMCPKKMRAEEMFGGGQRGSLAQTGNHTSSLLLQHSSGYRCSLTPPLNIDFNVSTLSTLKRVLKIQSTTTTINNNNDNNNKKKTISKLCLTKTNVSILMSYCSNNTGQSKTV